MDYRDIDFGFLDDVIDKASYGPLYAFVVSNAYIDTDGSEKVGYTRYEITGSLQAYSRQRRYDTDGTQSNISSRPGKFWAKYNVILNEGDLIQRLDNGQFFRVTQVYDYDYAGVRKYDVERLGLDEVRKYDFTKYVEAKFPEVI